MDQDEDYVIISHSDATTCNNASTSGFLQVLEEPALTPARFYLKQYTRAYKDMLQASNNQGSISGAQTEAFNISMSLEATYLNDISSYVDSICDILWPVNKKIHDNPELGYEEYIAHETLTEFMRCQNGWKVTPSAYGLETAWVAVYDSGREGPVVSFNAEMGMYLPLCLGDSNSPCSSIS